MKVRTKSGQYYITASVSGSWPIKTLLHIVSEEQKREDSHDASDYSSEVVVTVGFRVHYRPAHTYITHVIKLAAFTTSLILEVDLLPIIVLLFPLFWPLLRGNTLPSLLNLTFTYDTRAYTTLRRGQLFPPQRVF